MTNKPIKLDLYDSNDEVSKTLTKGFIPWKMLKEAAKLGTLKEGEINEEKVDEITDFVVRLFGAEKVTRAEIEEGASIQDMVSVLTEIISVANGTIQTNPPLPGK